MHESGTTKYNAVIAVESHGPISSDALQFLSWTGSHLVETTGDVRASSFKFQRIFVVVQRINSVLLHDDFVDDDREYRCTAKQFV